MNFLTEEDMFEFAMFLIEENGLPLTPQMGVSEPMDDFTLCVKVLKGKGFNLAFGDVENTKIRNINVSFLVHGNDKERETEYVANKLFLQLEKLKNGFYCDDIPIIQLVTDFDRPSPLGIDKNGKFEFIIDFTIRYRCD